MLEINKNSIMRVVNHTLLCMALSTTVMNTVSLAASNTVTERGNVSFEFNDIPLKSIFQLIMNATNQDVVGYDMVPDVTVSISASDVNGAQLRNFLLNCSGLMLSERDKGFEISVDKSVNPENITECIESFEG